MASIRAGTMRHVVDVMRPTKTKGSLGQTLGEPETLIAQVPCSIENLSGRELELARSTFSAAAMKVQMYGDPSKPIKATDYLQFGSRNLYIGNVNDRDQNGVYYTLICGEEVA